MKSAQLLDEETTVAAAASPADHFDAASSASNSSQGGSATGVAGGHSLTAFKTASAAAILEYFDSSDADEVERRYGLNVMEVVGNRVVLAGLSLSGSCRLEGDCGVHIVIGICDIIDKRFW
jgi:hypothetical protein